MKRRDREALFALFREAADDLLGRTSPYPATYSILTVHFAPGSRPEALAIPYQPWHNRTDILVPYRLVVPDELAGIPDPTEPQP